MQNIYLTPQENKAIHLFAKGLNTSIARFELDIPRPRWDRFAQNLRRVTGIANLKDWRACQNYITQSVLTSSNRLAPEQVAVFRLYINGPSDAPHAPKLTPEEIRQCVDDHAPSIGIFTKDERARKQQIRTYFSIYHSTNGKPLTETELAAFRLVAQGVRPDMVYLELGGNSQYFVKLIRNTCLRLGFNVQGRGAQKRMIQDYLARIDAQAMNDPMF